MKYVCAWLIRLYRKFLSPLKRNPCCRFTPSCSAYALEAFMNRGFFVGLWLTVRRILRCNPFCAGGYDPVPPKRIPKYQRSKTDGKESVPNPGADNDNRNNPKKQQENGSV